MFFWCRPPSGKCEWANLRKFAEHFNNTFSTEYKLAKCLDVSDSSKPQPEVLLESSGDKCMVIERKAIVFPPNYLKHHHSEHEFGNHFVAKANSAFQDDLYMLEINTNDVHRSKKDLRDLAEQIAKSVIANQQEVRYTGEIYSSQPLRWCFRRLSKYERDEDAPEKGVGVYFSEPWSLPEENRDQSSIARKQVADQLNKLLAETAVKFANYSDCIRILLLEVYGDDMLLNDGDVDGIITSAKLPQNIDQIWVAAPEWISDLEFQIVYRQVSSVSLN